VLLLFAGAIDERELFTNCITGPHGFYSACGPFIWGCSYTIGDYTVFVQLQMFESKQRRCRNCGVSHLAIGHEIQRRAPDVYTSGRGWSQALGFCSVECFNAWSDRSFWDPSLELTRGGE